MTRRALVTGANRGLGLAVSRRLAEQDVDVVVSARHLDSARAAAATVGRGTSAVALDVTDDASIAAARDRIGPIDILINNAGVLLDDGAGPQAVRPSLVARTFEVNTLGAWRTSQAFLPGMVGRRWGRIVMISSGTASFSRGLHGGTPAYSVSKAALNAVTVMLAAIVPDSGVLINAVNPGRVRTRMMPDAPVEALDAAVDVARVALLPDSGPTGTFFRSGKPIDW